MKSRKNFKGEGLRISVVFITGSGGKGSIFLTTGGRFSFPEGTNTQFFRIFFRENLRKGQT